MRVCDYLVEMVVRKFDGMSVVHGRSLDPLRFPQRKSVRLIDHDYAGGIYFITICVAERRPVFGRVDPPSVRLTRLGKIVEEEWLRTGKMRSNVWLDTYVVMPDHFHAIVGLAMDGARNAFGSRAHAVRPYRGATLGTVVAGFKSACTRRYRATLHEVTAVLWQRGYYEHVIQGSNQLRRARRYIVENPLRG